MTIPTPIPGRPLLPSLKRGGMGDANSIANAIAASAAAASQAYQAYELSNRPGYVGGYLGASPLGVSGGISGGTVLLIGLAAVAFFMARR